MTLSASPGTLVYKAPETFGSQDDSSDSGEEGGDGGAIVSPASDVYSWGIMAWEVVTGVGPWSHLKAQETELLFIHYKNLVAATKGKEVKRPQMLDGSDWQARVSEPLAALISDCWAQVRA